MSQRKIIAREDKLRLIRACRYGEHVQCIVDILSIDRKDLHDHDPLFQRPQKRKILKKSKIGVVKLTASKSMMK